MAACSLVSEKYFEARNTKELYLKQSESWKMVLTYCL